MNYLNLAKHSSFFKDFELMDFNALLRCLSIRIKVYKAGEIIEYEGNIAKNAYLTLSGKTRTALIDENGKAIPCHDYTKDMIFGLEYDSLKDNAYKEEFFAVEDSVVLICDLHKLLNPCENYCPRHRALVKKCISALSSANISSKQRIIELGQSKTKDKVLTYLSNNLPKANHEYQIPYNRQELADYLGVERSALSACLSDLKKEGLIDFNKSKFKRIK